MLLLLELGVFDKDLAVFAPVFRLERCQLSLIHILLAVLAVDFQYSAILFIDVEDDAGARRTKPGCRLRELARTGTRLKAEQPPRPVAPPDDWRSSFPSQQGAPDSFTTIHTSDQTYSFEPAEQISYTHLRTPELLKSISNMASIAVGLDRTRLLKPLIVLAGWTFVQEVSSKGPLSPASTSNTSRHGCTRPVFPQSPSTTSVPTRRRLARR